LHALDLPAASPPREEDDIRSAIGPARAEQASALAGTYDPLEENAEAQGRYAA